jgi:thiol-disulfide isomerase/thioredoxin
MSPTTNHQPPIGRMPDFAAGEWINTPIPLARESLRGQVVLIDFWNYTSANCIRTLPYMTNWHSRYADLGLAVIGVHTPEFGFARTRVQIEAAAEEFGIRYPVLLDNDYQTWARFDTRAWPVRYLIDHRGNICYAERGEGACQETEQAIQNALRERDRDISLPRLLPPLRREDIPGAICYQTTPEMYAGYERGALGNPQGYAQDNPAIYEMPLPDQRHEGHFYTAGIWHAAKECLGFAGQDGGLITLPYRALGVNAVLSPSSNPVELLLNLPADLDLRRRTQTTRSIIEVRQDGAPLNPANAGADIQYDDGGLSYVQVGRPRMVGLVQNMHFEEHELELTFRANGQAVYAFTFTTCVKPYASDEEG